MAQYIKQGDIFGRVGSNSAARMAMIEITTSSSMSVNALLANVCGHKGDLETRSARRRKPETRRPKSERRPKAEIRTGRSPEPGRASLRL